MGRFDYMYILLYVVLLLIGQSTDMFKPVLRGHLWDREEVAF
jgi:hypothetical protein